MTTDPNTSSFYRRRAAEARALAFAATLQGVRKIHLDMASAYERQADEVDGRSTGPGQRAVL